MFFAAYNPYGTRTALNEHNVPTVYTFATKRDRDNWVNDDAFIDGNFHREEISARDAKYWMLWGAEFVDKREEPDMETKTYHISYTRECYEDITQAILVKANTFSEARQKLVAEYPDVTWLMGQEAVSDDIKPGKPILA